MRYLYHILLAFVVTAFVAYLLINAHDNLQWVYGTHGGEKCYIVGTEHKNVQYPSEPFDSYQECMEAVVSQP